MVDERDVTIASTAWIEVNGIQEWERKPVPLSKSICVLCWWFFESSLLWWRYRSQSLIVAIFLQLSIISYFSFGSSTSYTATMTVAAPSLRARPQPSLDCMQACTIILCRVASGACWQGRWLRCWVLGGRQDAGCNWRPQFKHLQRCFRDILLWRRPNSYWIKSRFCCTDGRKHLFLVLVLRGLLSFEELPNSLRVLPLSQHLLN